MSINENFKKKDIIPVLFFFLAIISFTRVSSIITTALVLISLYFMGKDSENKTEYLMLAWIFSSTDILQLLQIKVNRYILPAFPAIIYFVLLSIDTINNHLKIKENIIPLTFIALFVIQAFTFTFTIEPTDKFKSIEDVSDYIIDNKS